MASIDHSVQDHGVGCRIDLRTVHADDRKVEVEIIVTPVVGEPLFTAAMRDVTERRATAEKLMQANRLASIGTLAAGLGHDMNNVLFPIRAHLNALHIRGTARAAVDDIGHVNAIGQGVAYLQQLADGLHYLVKGDPDDKEFGPATRLNEWWSRVGTLIVQSLPANVDVTIAIPQDLPAVQVSQQQLTQAVLNLVVNAGEAIASRGAGWPGHVVISAAKPSVGHSVVLSVNDDGVGMSEAVRERAMDTFFTTKVRSLGTGLGLALVARVVRHAGGSVIVQSREGEGSTIILELPIADRRARFSEIKVAVTLADGRAASFLVATLTARGLTSVTLDDASDADVWIVDPCIVTPQKALAWREIRSGRRVVRFGKANPGHRAAWSAVAAATVERTEDFDDLLLGAGRACDIIAELQHQSASTTRRIER
jgi:signal transduction histidine kinase